MRDTDLKSPRTAVPRIASEAFLEAALEAIVVTDHEGTVVDFNPAAERLFGRPRSEAVGHPWADLLLPDRDRPDLGRPMGTGEHPLLDRRREITVVKADGTEFPAEVRAARLPGGGLPCFALFLQDITDRRRAASHFRTEEEQVRRIADALPALVTSVDATGRYLFVNQAFETWIRRPLGEILGRPVQEVIGERAYRALKPAIEAALAGCEVAVEAAVDGPDGTCPWIRAHYVPRRGEDGGPDGYVALVTDLSEAKRARDVVQRLNASLEQRVAERTAQLDAFAYSVSHDLRAPLRAIRGFCQILLEDYRALMPDDQAREFLRRIMLAAERMDHLIEDILAYSRIGAGEIRLERVSVRGVLDGVFKDMGPDLRDSRVEVDPDLPPVLAHEVTLAQVLRNLISNAVKYVPPGTTPLVRIRAETRDGRVRVWVEDNGIGIPPEHQERIFRVFERLHPTEHYPGTGVGLAIVKKGVDRMGGDVGVDSQPGRGSRFWIDLHPAPDAPPPAPAAD